MTKQTNYQKNLISDFEKNVLIKSSSTPAFCSLPKSHNPFDQFPMLRPICSGMYSCTSHFSVFPDSFLKAAAQKKFLYVIDTTDFINKVSSHNFDLFKYKSFCHGCFF